MYKWSPLTGFVNVSVKCPSARTIKPIHSHLVHFSTGLLNWIIPVSCLPSVISFDELQIDAIVLYTEKIDHRPRNDLVIVALVRVIMMMIYLHHLSSMNKYICTSHPLATKVE